MTACAPLPGAPRACSTAPAAVLRRGKCEISKEVDCIWDMIVKKKMEKGRLEDLTKMKPNKDWRTARDGGPRKSVREELVQ